MYKNHLRVPPRQTDDGVEGEGVRVGVEAEKHRVVARGWLRIKSEQIVERAVVLDHVAFQETWGRWLDRPGRRDPCLQQQQHSGRRAEGGDEMCASTSAGTCAPYRME